MPQTSQWPLPADSIRYVVPDPIVSVLAAHPLAADLYPLAFGHYRRAAGHHMHRRQHRDDLLIYCTDGRAYLNVEGEPFTVSAGDLVLLPAGADHRYVADPDAPWTIHWVHYTGPRARDFQHHMGFSDRVRIRPLGLQPRLLVDFNGLLSVRQTGFRTSVLVNASNRLRQLLSAVPMLADAADDRRQLDLDLIHGFMRERLTERITLDQLAELGGLSSAHFATRYRALTGESPIQHFLHLKVEQACQWLDTTSLSFTEISHRLGYEDNYYFSRLFKKVMGLSPRDYRHTRRH